MKAINLFEQPAKEYAICFRYQPEQEHFMIATSKDDLASALDSLAYMKKNLRDIVENRVFRVIANNDCLLVHIEEITL